MPSSIKPRKPRRNFKLAVRLLPEQRRRLKRHARAAGLTVSAYVVHLIENKQLSRSRRDEPPLDLVPIPLLAHWQRIGNNINQIARALNRGRHASAEWITETLAELFRVMIEDQLTRRFARQFGADRIAGRLR